MTTYYEYSHRGVFPDRDVFPKEWKVIADLDESEPYEIDQTRIYLKDDGGFAVARASGCSCWEGDWETEDFASLDDIEGSVLRDDLYVWNPSLKGARALVSQARLTVKDMEFSMS